MSKINRLPLQDVGLNNLVGIPYLLTLTEPIHTALRMTGKALEVMPAQYGFTNSFTVNGVTAPAYEFLFGKHPSHAISFAIDALHHRLLTDGENAIKSIYDPHVPRTQEAGDSAPVNPSSLNHLTLENAEQFAMGWTNYHGIYGAAKQYLPMLVSCINSADEATKNFWPILGTYSYAHNLLILQKVRDAQAEAVKSRFGDAWNAEGMESLHKAGRLYTLDLSILDCIATKEEDNPGRYAHATFALLRQDPATKALEPFAIWVSGKSVDGRARIYTRSKATPGVWLYALQAVKASITVYAIWCRHAYIWHVIPGALQMTMFNTMEPSHPIYRLLEPMSRFTIAFNELLLLFWKYIAPPTSISKSTQFLRLANEFANGRKFFDDDPKMELERLGLRKEDFTNKSPWDQYALVKDLLEIWDATERYVDACVDAMYSDDAAVAGDQGLKAWMKANSAPDQGNIPGLEPIDSKRALKRFLTSVVYRVTAHGAPNVVDPAILIHMFAPSFPPCLRRRDIPDPGDQLDTKQFMTYLPDTGLIGIISTFYFTFVIAKPYVPFVPKKGPEADLFFPLGMNDARNRALVAYRKFLAEFITKRAMVPDQVGQWPLSIEI